MTSRFRLIGWLPLISPVVIVLLVYLAWGVAFWQLGRLPLASADDPKFIGGISSAVTRTVSVLVPALVACWLLSTVASAVVGAWPRTRDATWWFRQATFGLGAIAVFIFSMRFWPGNAAVWFLD